VFLYLTIWYNYGSGRSRLQVFRVECLSGTDVNGGRLFLQSIFEAVVARDPAQPEFLQAVEVRYLWLPDLNKSG
jgi:hypothetical protein